MMLRVYRFRANVGAGTINIDPGNYASLLYDQKLADGAQGDDAITAGLLWSLLLAAVSNQLHQWWIPLYSCIPSVLQAPFYRAIVRVICWRTDACHCWQAADLA